MNALVEAWKNVDRNKLAAVLSVVPGLGHLYKHHYLSGFGILIAGNVLIGFIAGLLAFATLGFSLVVVPAAWLAGVASAWLPDGHQISLATVTRPGMRLRAMF